MENLLVSDASLCLCFNKFLSLPIFPIHLYYDPKSLAIHEMSHSDRCYLICAKEDSDQTLYNKVMDWLDMFCWPFFLKSALYCKYRLLCKLKEGIHTKFDFIDLIHMEQSLKFTVAAPLLEIWVACEGNYIGVTQQWACSHVIRVHCNSIPFLSTLATGMGINWIQLVKEKILHRLKWYWLPRYFHHFPHVQDNTMEIREESDPFHEGFLLNFLSGDPFKSFLSSQHLYGKCHQLSCWQDCYTLLMNSSGEKLIGAGWHLWSKYFLSNIDGAKIECNLAIQLYEVLQSGTVDNIFFLLKEIKDDMFSSLKRVWTLYQKNLFFSYMDCLGADAVKPGETTKLSHLIKMDFKSYKKKQIDPKILLQSDLVGGIFEALYDIETFLQFEQFVYISRGPLSDENAYLKLWKAIKRHNKTVEKDRRESLAIAIHKNFISDQSKYCLSFPQAIRDMLEENDPQHVPSTPVLNRLFQIAEDNLDPLVKQFLTSMGEHERSFSAIQKKAHILSLALTLNKKRTNGQLQEDALHLHKTLSLCEGPITHKLQAFSDYLVEYAYPSSPVTMANNVQFWLEVNKLKVMHNSDASVSVLYHKSEALVDRYLDTATPPWIKISITPETAVMIVSAVQELRRSKIAVNSNHIVDLFENAQQRVFSDMVPYWGSFCKLYKSPIESTVSLPQVASYSPQSSLKVSQIFLPPLPRTKENAVPLLSYSKLTGIKWRRTLNLPVTDGLLKSI